MFCRNCGKEVTPNSDYCLNCGARPLAGTTFCPACAGNTTPLSEICVKCGTRLTNNQAAGISPSTTGKSKAASIVMAVFLSYWTWLYTYQKDGWKFWTGLGVSTVLTVAFIIVMVSALTNSSGGDWYFKNESFPQLFQQIMVLYLVEFAVLWGISIWAIVDTAIKSNKWYSQYPNVK
jgi:hypothetical protein